MRRSDGGPFETWARGAAYEPFIGRWSRLIAAEFLSWLGIPGGSRWLDIGCGTGALSLTILDRARPARVEALDLSPDYVLYSRKHISDPRFQFLVANAQAVPLSRARFDAVVSALTLNFVPDPARAVLEMARACHPGGLVGVYVWDYAGEMQILRYFWETAIALDPVASELDEGGRFPICNPQVLHRLFEGAGLLRIDVRSIDISAVFPDFDDYWSPFLGGQGPAAGYVMSLGEEGRVRLRERLRATLPIAADGSFSLIARAWAVRGYTPARARP